MNSIICRLAAITLGIYCNDWIKNLSRDVLNRPTMVAYADRGGSHTIQLKFNLFIKVTHNTYSLHLVSNFQNSSKHTKPSIENSTSLW